MSPSILLRRTCATLCSVACLASPLVAQGAGESRESTAASRAAAFTVLGATSGAIAGGLLGAVVGAYTASGAQPCQIGDPDGCLGATLPRAVWGTGIGMTLGTPVGAHLGNRSRGKLAYTAAASVALFAGEVIALRSLVDEGRTRHKSAVMTIVVGVPVLQIAATTVVERALRRE